MPPALGSDNPAAPTPAPLPIGPQGVNIMTFGAGVSPAGTTSLTGVMMGLGSGGSAFVFTPTTTGRVLFIMGGAIANNTASDGAIVGLRYGIGTPPANGAAPAGAQMSPLTRILPSANSAALGFPITCVGIATALTLGVPVWVDAILFAITGGTATLTSAVAAAIEF